VNMLLDANADVADVDDANKNNSTPLHLAVRSGNIDAMRQLLAYLGKLMLTLTLMFNVTSN